MTPDDGFGVNELFARVFGIQRTQAQWQWKYWDNPHGAPIACVARIGDQVVGHYGLIPRKIRIGDQLAMAYQETDLMIHPEHSQGGLFRELGQRVYEEAKQRGSLFTFGFPNQVSLPIGKRILKWRPIARIPLMTFLISPRVLLARKLKKIPAVTNIGNGADICWRWFHTRLLSHAGDASITRDMPSDMDSLVSSNIHSDRFTFLRDSAYFQWRYSPVSGKNYVFISTRDQNGILIGAAVLGIEEHGEGHLTEFILKQDVLKQDVRSTGKSLLKAAITVGLGNHCHLLRIWAIDGSALHRMTRSLAFWPRDSKLFHVIRSFQPPEFNRTLWDPDHWMISSGDSDCV